MTSAPPIVWSIAGTDSGGGAGLAADQRAAQGLGVHLCPVVAAVTAQNSTGVTRIDAVDPALLDAQLAALAGDMAPAVIKTGLLGSVANLHVLLRWVDRLRAERPLALVVDPVLRSSTGAAFADDALIAAYRDELLPRATLVKPNRREAAALLGLDATPMTAADVPALARALQASGAASVCLTGGDSDDGVRVGNDSRHRLRGGNDRDDRASNSTDRDPRPLVLDYLLTTQARGWLALPRIGTPHHHGTGCTFASGVAAALALGFVEADAAVLAKMLTAQALHDAITAGRGAGPVQARSGFALRRDVLPQLSLDDTPPAGWAAPRAAVATRGSVERLDLYAIVDSAARVQAVLDAGVRTVQLRIKADATADPESLRREVAAAVLSARAAGARLFINDHWQLALELGAGGVHLGQEDLLTMSAADRASLQAAGLGLGLSSHSLWELCRAAAMAPAYVACGPVWPTLTKRMPWRAQGLDNLAWWCAMAPAPVVAIGGILEPAQAAEAARCGPDGLCIVRGLGEDPRPRIEAFAQALAAGRAGAPVPVPALPHPSL